jgi:hypothetical protein
VHEAREAARTRQQVPLVAAARQRTNAADMTAPAARGRRSAASAAPKRR